MAADAPAEAAPVADPRSTLAPIAASTLEQFREQLGDAVIESAACYGDAVVRVRSDAWSQAARVAHDDLECDYLSFIAGIDWMPTPRAEEDEGSGDTSAPVQPRETTYGVAGSTGRFQVFARVASTSRPGVGLTIKTDVDEHDMRVASWCDVYPGADWHERECWEMYGVAFDGHPALRHLYLPAEFEGHPLRKDFPLLAREVKPWPGLVDVEPMPGEAAGDDDAEGGA